MTRSKILKKIIMELWYFILAYISNFILPRINEAFVQSKKYFISYLWSSLKKDFKKNIKEAIVHVENYSNFSDSRTKESLIIDALFKKIKLPIIMKIFKPIIKKLLRNRLHRLIKTSDKKSEKTFNTTA